MGTRTHATVQQSNKPCAGSAVITVPDLPSSNAQHGTQRQRQQHTSHRQPTSAPSSARERQLHDCLTLPHMQTATSTPSHPLFKCRVVTYCTRTPGSLFQCRCPHFFWHHCRLSGCSQLLAYWLAAAQPKICRRHHPAATSLVGRENLEPQPGLALLVPRLHAATAAAGAVRRRAQLHLAHVCHHQRAALR